MRIRDRLVVAALVAGIALPGAIPLVRSFATPVEVESPGPLPVRGIDVVTPGGRRHLTVEVASDDRSRAYGLMNRDALAEGHGMLFDFGGERPVSFWMRNTRIPLDMAFIRADGTVASVHAGARPMDETPIPSGTPVRYVLEVGDGVASRLGMAPGTRVEVGTPGP